MILQVSWFSLIKMRWGTQEKPLVISWEGEQCLIEKNLTLNFKHHQRPVIETAVRPEQEQIRLSCIRLSVGHW